jgi:pyridoxal 5'-phosphate synthase pdxT subunit
MIQIGVLALQGAFIEHRKKLEALGVKTFEIRKLEDLNKKMDGLVLPGGESTAMRKLLDDLNLFLPLKQMIHSGLPTLGTCAGLILLSKSLKGKDVAHFQAIDIETERNAYGRQLGSFKTKDLFDGVEIPMTFIRAPYITQVGRNVKVLSTVDGKIVAARENHVLVVAFHPELSDSNHVHLYFLQMIQSVTT